MGREWVPPKVHPKWIDPSQLCQIDPKEGMGIPILITIWFLSS